MIERLRTLVEEPFDPQVVRTAVALAGSILIALAAFLVLAFGLPDLEGGSQVGTAPVDVGALRAAPPSAGYLRIKRFARRQDPQDMVGSLAAQRASRALRSVRALQHVPYRSDELRVKLIGARGSRAVLRVTAETARAARRGWWRFLRRYGDSGRAYIPIFRGTVEERDG